MERNEPRGILSLVCIHQSLVEGRLHPEALPVVHQARQQESVEVLQQESDHERQRGLRQVLRDQQKISYQLRETRL